MEELTAEEQELLNGFAAPSQQSSFSQEEEEQDSGELDAAELQLLQDVISIQTDELTGEEKPHQTWGASPDQPANESVLSLVDRAKLALGDPVGRVNYLKSQYEDATMNDKGELTVKSNGRWFYADPRGFEFTKDPWEKSKEIIADTAADMSGELMIMGGAIGGGAIGTAAAPGAGTAAGGVVGAAWGEYMRSSLGRVVGTYQADAVQQTKDIAFESLFQLAGEKFVPGMKKGLKHVANGVEKLGLKAGTEKGAAAIAKFYSRFNVGESAMQTITKYGTQVKEKMKTVAKATGSDNARYIEHLQNDSIQHVKNLSSKAPRILSRTYQKFQGKIMESVDEGFKSNINTSALESYAKSLDDGIAKMVRKVKDPVTGKIRFKTLEPEAVMQTMQFAQKSGRMPKGTSVVLKSQAELVKKIKKTGDFSGNALKIANDPEAYGLLKQLHSNIDIAYKTKPSSGRHAAKNMMAYKREMGDILFNLSSKADDAGLNSMRNSFKGYHDIIESNTKEALDNVGQGGLYTQMNSEWSKLKTQLTPLARAHVQSFKGNTGDAAFESLVNKLKTNPGKNQLSKGSLEAIEAAAKTVGDVESQQAIRQSRVALDINDAAAAFNPYLTRPGPLGLAMVGYGTIMGNYALVMAVGGISTAAGSPKVTKNLVYGAKNMWRGMNWMKSMGGAAVERMSKDPTASAAFINTMVDGTAVQTQVNDQLMSQILPQAAASEPVPQDMAEGQMASQDPTPYATTSEVDIKEISMEDLRANAVGTRLKPAQLGVTAMAAQSEGSIDALSNNLKALKADSRGGLSLGLYHLSNGQKTLPKFLKDTGLEKEFEGYDPIKRPKEYAKRWAEKGIEMGELKFAKIQMDWMLNKSPDITTTRDALKAKGMDFEKLPKALQALVFSSTVSIGGDGTAEALKWVHPKREPADQVAEMSLGRLHRWMTRKKTYNSNGSVRFDPKNFRAGWVSRALKEHKKTVEGLTGRQMTSEERVGFGESIYKVVNDQGHYNNRTRDIIKRELGVIPGAGAKLPRRR